MKNKKPKEEIKPITIIDKIKYSAYALKLKTISKVLSLRNKAPELLIYPDSRLKKISEPVNFEKTPLKERVKIVRMMGAVLGKQSYGSHLGISAPQIGINKRVIIVRGNVMFNPSWNPVKYSPNTRVDSIEASYSVPGKFFKVDRAKYGWAKWTNIEGRPMEDKLVGMAAIVFQHELDHLNGKCCNEVGIEVTPPKKEELSRTSSK
jgi:peptide deformylase